MSRFVRPSKYRHVFGTASKRDQCYDNLKVSRSAWDTNIVKANAKYISVNIEASGGGAFAVIPLEKVGKAPETLPLFNGHTSAVLDTDFNPFNDSVVASASEDCTAKVWIIPEGGLTESVSTPALSLNGHGRKVGHVLFNPVVDNLLATASADFTIKLWDIVSGTEKQTLTGHTEIIQSIDWNYNGNLMITACKDKKLRLFDVRSNKIVSEAAGHAGVKGSRVTWAGDSTRFISTGFSKSSDRQVCVWDTTDLSKPVKEINVDTASGMLIPYFDPDTQLLFLAGKGDGNIRYYEWNEDEGQNLYYLAEYKSSDALRGIAFLPKRSCNIAECEIARAFKVHPTQVEPISFKVPRKSDQFQADIYPETIGPEPGLTLAEFFAGKNGKPKMISLEKGFVPSATKEFVTTAKPIEEEAKIPQSEKEYQDAYHALRKENEDLKNALANKEARITQLEAQLAASGN